MSVRTVLLLRGAISVLFAAYLMFMTSAGVEQGLGRNGYFALLDGALGLALWFTLSKFSAGRWLSGLVFADAIMRLLIGVVTFIAPNIQSRVLGAVAYLGAIVIACIVLGAVGLIYVAMNKRSAPDGRRIGALPALIVSACTLLFGLALVLGLSTDDGRRSLVAMLTLALGLTYLVTGIRAKPRST
jgi:hypothetical protein